MFGDDLLVGIGVGSIHVGYFLDYEVLVEDFIEGLCDKLSGFLFTVMD